MLDDAQLLRRYAEEKSEAAFAELVARHLDLVYSAALRQVGGDTHRAQDVAQVVFTTLARKATALTHHPVLAGWLYTATQHVAAKAVRAEARRRVREREAHAMNEILSPDSAAVDWSRVRPVLDAAMRELNEPDRDAVLLRFFEKRPFAEIGAALHLTEDAARMRVERALDKLHAQLARRGVTSAASALAAVLANQAVASAPAGLAASVTGAALAGGASLGVAATVLNFMSTTKIVATAAGVVALFALGTTFYERAAAHTTAAALANTVRERDNLQASLARVQQRMQQSDDDLAALRKELDDLRASAAKTATAPTPTSRAATGGFKNAAEYALDHPETRAAFIDNEVLRAKARFERFLKQAQLSPAQQEQFLKNLRDYSEGKLDFLGVIRSYDYNLDNLPHDPATVAQMGRLEKQIPLDLQDNMRSLLGSDGFQQYQQYTRTLPLRNTVAELAGRLYDTAEPLTAAQADQLTDIMAQNPFRTPVEGFRGNTIAGTFIPVAVYNGAKTQLNLQGGSTLTDWHEPVSDAAATRAAAVLTPAQIAALRLVQEQQVAQFLSRPPVRSPDVPAKKIPPTPGK